MSSSSSSNSNRERPDSDELQRPKRQRTNPQDDEKGPEQKQGPAPVLDVVVLLTDDEDDEKEEKNDEPMPSAEDELRNRGRRVLQSIFERQRGRFGVAQLNEGFREVMMGFLMRGPSLDPTFDRVTLPPENPMDKLEILLEDGDRVLEGETCAVCLESVDGSQSTHIVKPPACDHYFHLGCAEPWFREHTDCPVCRTPVTVLRGTQPEHADNVVMQNESYDDLAGFPGDGTLEIIFFMPSGIQGVNHPMPGRPYNGSSVTAYLPNNSEGQEMARLFRLAFERNLLFRIGFNEATNQADQIIVNGIELKVRRNGGPLAQGFPDPSYFCRLKIDLREMGVY